MGGQSFSIPLAAGSDQKGSVIPGIFFILKVIDRRTKNRQMGGQSFSIPLAAGSDQKGSVIPGIFFILKVIDRRTKNRRT
jgi:hypothetical protein